MNSDLEKDIKTVQNDVFASLQNVDPFAEASGGDMKGLIHDILTFDRNIVELFLGNAGTRLLEFANAVDHAHPHLFDSQLPSSVLDGLFDRNSKLTKEIVELLEVFEWAHLQNMQEAMGFLSKSAAREFGSHFKDVNSPVKNQQYVRLLKTRAERDEVRKNKKVISIDLNSLAKKAEGSWDSLPKVFGHYARGSSTIKAELEKAERMVQKYRNMRCNSLYFEVTKSLEAFNEQRRESYYGFQRIKMADAALILAKAHGFEFIKIERSYMENYFESRSHIAIPSSFFGDYKVSMEEKPLSCKYKYTPRVYPAFELMGEFSSDAEMLIEKLEAFPECGGKSIFDHYIIVVPSISNSFDYDIDSVGNKKYYFFDKNGERVSSSSFEEIQKRFDINLIRMGYTVPVLLGEKDGNCHFLSYWTYQGEKR